MRVAKKDRPAPPARGSVSQGATHVGGASSLPRSRLAVPLPSAVKIIVTVIIYLTTGPADNLEAKCIIRDAREPAEAAHNRTVHFTAGAARANDNFNARIHHASQRTASCKSRERGHEQWNKFGEL